MKVRVLGCSGAIAKGCRTTAFLIDANLLIDAGTGVGDLTLDEMQGVDHVLLTHSHLDHVAALPLMVDAIAAQRQVPLQVYALRETLAALKTHVFNDVMWPDFTRIPTRHAPFIQFCEVAVGQVLQVGDKWVEVMSAAHSVPAAGYAVRRHGAQSEILAPAQSDGCRHAGDRDGLQPARTRAGRPEQALVARCAGQ
jgi:ribonuclease BN (tRNA processing enzyme)